MGGKHRQPGRVEEEGAGVEGAQPGRAEEEGAGRGGAGGGRMEEEGAGVGGGRRPARPGARMRGRRM